MLWQQILQSDQPWMRRTAQRSLIAARRRSIRSTSCRRLVRRAGLPAGPPDHVDRSRAQRRSCRAFPSIRPAPRTSSIPTPARVTISPAVQPQPDARSPPVRCDEHRHSRACLPRAPRPGGWQLSQRLHPSPAVACVGRQSRARAARRAATRWRWADNIPVVSYVMLRGRCRSCQARRSRSAIRSSSSSPWRCSCCTTHVFGADPILVPRLVFACAMIVLFAIDLEHHLLPERDHASGHRRRVSVLARVPARPGGVADRHSGRRRLARG